MPKRLTIVLMLIVLCACICSCSEAESIFNNDDYTINLDEINYPQVLDPQNSDLALTDTLTGNQVYIGQSKAELDRLYGEPNSYNSIGNTWWMYGDYVFFSIGFDDNNLVDEITIFNKIYYSDSNPDYYTHSPERLETDTINNNRFKTAKGLTLNSSFDDFQKLYERKYRITRNTYIVLYNDQKYSITCSKREDDLIEYLEISSFTLNNDLYPHYDYGNPNKIKNSDMSITDTKTGKQIYLGQPKKDIEEILGESYDILGRNMFSYEDHLLVRFDDKWCANQIKISCHSSTPKETKTRYKTNRKFDLNNPLMKFKILYNTNSEKVELEHNGVKFFIEIQIDKIDENNEFTTIYISAD